MTLNLWDLYVLQELIAQLAHWHLHHVLLQHMELQPMQPLLHNVCHVLLDISVLKLLHPSFSICVLLVMLVL